MCKGSSIEKIVLSPMKLESVSFCIFKNMNINPHLTSCIKLNSKWITDTKPKLEEACKLTQHLSGDSRQIKSFRHKYEKHGLQEERIGWTSSNSTGCVYQRRMGERRLLPNKKNQIIVSYCNHDKNRLIQELTIQEPEQNCRLPCGHQQTNSKIQL